MTGLATIALISNPRSTGNIALLPEIRAFIAANQNIYHYEIDDVAQVPEALRQIARIEPDILAINGGDGTVQRALTELEQGGWFKGPVPPVAVLPNGKTNLIAYDLGAGDDPLAMLALLAAIPAKDLRRHIVPRQLIRLTAGTAAPVFGMFLGGAGLAEIILFCRKHIYPLGLPNGMSHVLAAVVLFVMVLIGRDLSLRARELKVSVRRSGGFEGSFVAVLVTTLDTLLLNVRARKPAWGPLKLIVIERRRMTIVRTAWALFKGTLGQRRFDGFHLGDGDEIRIEGNRPCVILDGETYEAPPGESLLLRPTRPIAFVSFAAAS